MSKSALWRPLAVVGTIAAWLAIGAVGGQTFGVLSDVQENDTAAFLPESAESTLAAQEHAGFVESDSVPGLFVIEGITVPDDLPAIEAFVADAVAAPLEGDPEGRTVGDLLTAEPAVIPAEDGEAALVVFDLDEASFADTVGEAPLGELAAEAIRHAWDEQDLDADGYLSGAVGLVADLVAAFAGIDGILLAVALGVVLVILLIVYRSPVLPLLVLSTAMIALTGAIIAVYQMAKNDVITLNGQSQGIMFILVVGATTDYALLLVARYREELLQTRSPYSALWTAWRRSLEPIAASAGTVVLGLLVLMLSELKSNAALGPAGAIGIVAAFFAALTLLPALLLIGGKRARGVFWPAMPRYREEGVDTSKATVTATTGFWPSLSHRVAAKPRTYWLAASGALLVMAAGLGVLKADGIGDQDFFTTDVDSIKGFEVIETHFDNAGSSSPVRVLVDEADAESVLAAVSGVDGVANAFLLTPAVAQGAPGGVVPEPPIVVDGRVEIQAVTEASATSRAAQSVVEDIRAEVAPIADGVLVGGQAAESVDQRLTVERDLWVVIPTILAVIFIVLVGLLRSLLAPTLIVLANVLSFAAALGLSAVVFEFILGFPGMDPGTPLLGFVFLVALGVDYSIFLMSRAREESLKHGTKEGTRRALAVTGGVITSAGIVLAATFAALGVLPLIFLAQIAFIVGVGVLIDTFLVRSLVVPGLVIDIGRTSWWPWQKAIKN